MGVIFIVISHIFQFYPVTMIIIFNYYNNNYYYVEVILIFQDCAFFKNKLINFVYRFVQGSVNAFTSLFSYIFTHN